jgi:hypothetical protein
MNASDVMTSNVITIGRVAPVDKAMEGFPMHSGLQLPQHVVRRVKAIAAEIEELIRERAYGLWDQEGRPNGRALVHWVHAKVDIWHELIREGAFALWKQEGKPDGRDRNHWLQAEAEIWHALIREEAYALWERKGRPAGHDLNDWLQAKAAIEAVRFANWPVRVSSPWAVARAETRL